MNSPVLSTLQYAKSLQAVGFTESQAEVITEGVGTTHHAMQDFATKKELYEVRDQLNQKIDDKFNFLNSKVTHLEEKINCMADVLTSKLFNRLGGLIVACMSIGFSAVVFIIKGI
jgi:hypothetical protein